MWFRDLRNIIICRCTCALCFRFFSFKLPKKHDILYEWQVYTNFQTYQKFANIFQRIQPIGWQKCVKTILVQRHAIIFYNLDDVNRTMLWMKWRTNEKKIQQKKSKREYEAMVLKFFHAKKYFHAFPSFINSFFSSSLYRIVMIVVSSQSSK